MMSDDDGVLQRFMEEFFPFDELQSVGFFTEAMRGDYKAQAERVCGWLGLDTVYEYGATETRCHLTYAEGERPEDEPFVTTIPSVYE